MLDQLKWQKLEHRRDNSRLCCFLRLFIHFPTDDIPLPALITATRSSHERNFLVSYARTDVYINIHSS